MNKNHSLNMILAILILSLGGCLFYPKSKIGKRIFVNESSTDCFEKKKLKEISDHFFQQVKWTEDVHYSIKAIQISKENACFGLFRFSYWVPRITKIHYFLAGSGTLFFHQNDSTLDSLSLNRFYEAHSDLFSPTEMQVIHRYFLGGPKFNVNSHTHWLKEE